MGFEVKPKEKFSTLVLFMAILGLFKHLLKPFSKFQRDVLIIKITKIKQFSHQMALIEFKIDSAIKITHLQVYCRLLIIEDY